MSAHGPGNALRTAQLCALLLALGLCAAWPGSAARADEAQDTRRALEQLEQEIQRIAAAQQAREAQRAEVQLRLRDSERRLATLQQRREQLAGQIEENFRELTRLEARAGDLEAAAAAQQQRVAAEIRRAFKGARDDQLRLLLNQEDPQALARLLTYYRYVLGARNELLREYSATLDEIAAVRRSLQSTRASLDEQRAALAQRREETRLEQAQRQSLLAEIDAALASDAAALEERQRDRASLEDLLAEIEAAMAAVEIPMEAQPFSEARGQMPWPVEGRVTHGFGSPRNQGKMRWQGVRVRAEAGTTISAIHHGRVVYADWLRGSGLLLVIDHGEGYMSLYAHNETLLRDVGDWVSSGAPVATVGDSGGQSEAALYFEVRKDGTPTDPKNWCRG